MTRLNKEGTVRQGLNDVSIGEMTNIHRHLSTLGLSREQYIALGDKDEVLRQSVAGMIRWMTLFSSPEEQITRILKLNDNVWHDPDINREEIKKIGPPPFCPAPIFTEKEMRFYCLFLFYEFKYKGKGQTKTDPIKTFWRYWDAMGYVFGDNILAFGDDRYDNDKGEIVRDKKRRLLTFAEGSMDNRDSGLSWRLVEFYRFIEARDPGEARKQVFEISHDLCPRGLGHEILAIPVMHPKWMVEADLFERRHTLFSRNMKERKEESYWLGFGLQPLLALELNIVSDNGRSYIPELFRSNGIIYFNAAAGGGSRCPVYYKKLFPRYRSYENMLPSGD
jgi:hypothetical protein